MDVGWQTKFRIEKVASNLLSWCELPSANLSCLFSRRSEAFHSCSPPTLCETRFYQQCCSAFFDPATSSFGYAFLSLIDMEWSCRDSNESLRTHAQPPRNCQCRWFVVFALEIRIAANLPSYPTRSCSSWVDPVREQVLHHDRVTTLQSRRAFFLHTLVFCAHDISELFKMSSSDTSELW